MEFVIVDRLKFANLLHGLSKVRFWIMTREPSMETFHKCSLVALVFMFEM
jgi:hypothetical protein